MRTDRQIGRSTTASQTGRQQRTHYGWKSWRGEETGAGLLDSFIYEFWCSVIADWSLLVVCGLSEFFWLQNEINLMRYDILVISNSPGIKLEIYIKNTTTICRIRKHYEEKQSEKLFVKWGFYNCLRQLIMRISTPTLLAMQSEIEL